MNRHYVPNYTGSPSWQANDFFNAHSRTLGLSRDRFPHSWFGELWAAIRSILRIGGSHIEEAQLAHSKYYYQGYFEPPYSTRELAAAAGYQAFLIWENHHTILMPSFVPAMKEVLEWISGIAIAESCKLCEELAFTNEKDIREACEWAAKTSQKCYEETHSRIKRFRRHSVGNQRRHQEYYNSKYLPGQSDTMYGGYTGYDDYGAQYGYEQPYMNDGYYGNGFLQRFKYQSLDNQKDNDEEVDTSEKLTLATFFALGISMLLPWNALILALPFFDDAIPYDFFPSSLSAAFTIPNFLTLAFATLTHPGSDVDSRVKRSLMLMTIPLASLGFLAYISGTFKPEFLYICVLICATCTAVGSAYLQSAGTAIASLYGPSHLKAIFTGQGLVAVLVSVFQLLLQIFSSGTQEDVAAANAIAILSSYAISTLILIVSAGIFYKLSKTATFIEITSNNKLKTPSLHPIELMKQVNSRVWEYGSAVMVDFAVTLAVFPTITVLVRSSDPIESQPLLLHSVYFPLVHFLAFNLADLAGRALPSVELPKRFKSATIKTIHPTSSKVLIGMSASRLIFIPLFLASNIPNTAPSFLKHDSIFFLLIAFFGLSNGYIATNVFTAGTNEQYNVKLNEPLSIPGEEEHNAKDIGASVLVFYLTGGLSIGN
ncbi:hypothetical protein E3Q18_03513 [Wallemia mellicola]|uniref:Nucleoside transporter n=1 Tax=Wallemia mellicola TaxID=1708541 RepID=A0A4T0THW4_9BASI|nr:hypothetical protein E3Q23_02617 [Wallemia mellicola]TIB88509.1 hypothetical protein E3Q19_03325 [Wallemia mellicola]TIB95739.1 hypothetical protein E3Q18_03513 [Wallemia mellicola]TIB99307.1 hypothetical protein E3Q17_02659 [Wallemia mellicola]TIC10551.1 hypothetical protein E3Q14_02749 [Wallemia mellicola]